MDCNMILIIYIRPMTGDIVGQRSESRAQNGYMIVSDKQCIRALTKVYMYGEEWLYNVPSKPFLVPCPFYRGSI